MYTVAQKFKKVPKDNFEAVESDNLRPNYG